MPVTSTSSFLNATQIPATQGDSTVKQASDVKVVQAGQQGKLGKQDFLKLLMAQLQNQDPMKPMDDTAMIAQMAQFSALEETQQLRQVLQQSSNTQTVNQAANMIGKYVQADQSDGSSVRGAVTGVTFTTSDGAVTPVIKVGDQSVDYSTINQVSSSPIN
jgi:flagellar basal-body rod modification protein FlgD